jgi:hypothetical protein
MKKRLFYFLFWGSSLIFLLILTSGCSPMVISPAVILNDTVETTSSTLHWVPVQFSSFQIQFSGETDLTTDAQIIDLDAFDTDQAVVEQFHQAGKKVICYINAGSAEDWRPDMDRFPAEVIGKDYEGWPGENWLDIRRLDILQPILDARLDMCKAKGFDGVEFDNMDGYQNDTGFDLTAEDQLIYNRWLADAAHSRVLAVGLKNDPEQIADLEPSFDFTILESCFKWEWCGLSAPFVKAGKPVFDIEYGPIDVYCAQAKNLSITLIGKNLELDAQRITCE